MFLNKDKAIKFINFTALGLLSLFSYGYSMWASRFAENHIKFGFLDFPIFLGEILLFLCFCLMVVKFFVIKRLEVPGKLLILLYGIFILSKAAIGYLEWGVLALRHAALFYYMFFALLGWYFYDRRFFGSMPFRVGAIIAIVMGYANLFVGSNWVFTSGCLLIVLASSFKNKYLKAVLLILLAVLYPYKFIFFSSRMMMVGNFIAFCVLILAVCMIYFRKIRSTLAVAALAIIIIASLFYNFADPNAIKSLTYFKGYKARYERTMKLLEKKEKKVADTGLPQYEKVRLFNPNPNETEADVYIYEASKKTGVKPDELPEDVYAKLKKNDEHQGLSSDGQVYTNLDGLSHDNEELDPSFLEQVHKSLDKPFYDQEKQNVEDVDKVEAEWNQGPRNTNVAFANALFRLFIWKDMITELLDDRPIFGFDFGKPLRPRTLLVLEWSSYELKRDGWLAAHNSLLHYIYRAGVIGVALVCLMLFGICKMILRAIKLRKFKDLLMSAVLVSWMVASNFFLIFELPQTAIPLWTLAGLLLARLFKKDADVHEGKPE